MSGSIPLDRDRHTHARTHVCRPHVCSQDVHHVFRVVSWTALLHHPQITIPQQEAHLDVNNQASTRQLREHVLPKIRQTYESRVIFSVDVDEPCSVVFSPVLL